MKSQTLKRIIGGCLFVVAMIILHLLHKTSVIELQRFLFCCVVGLLGLSARAFIYYGFLKKDENRPLKVKEIWDCVFAYFLFYPMGLGAVISIIFITSYENLKDMNNGLFYTTSFFLFYSIGFAVMEAVDKFIFTVNKKGRDSKTVSG